MAQNRRNSRRYLTFGALALIGASLAAAFWPHPVLVDMAEVARGPMQVTIDEAGRTRVRDAYVVSTPVAGRLQRVEVNPGDPVVRGKTVVAHMLPINPTALDVRTREQARAALTAAEAALRVAQADLNAAVANRDLAEADLGRTSQLAQRGIVSDAALDRAKQTFRIASAAVDTAEAAIAVREAERTNAQALLIGFDDRGLAAAVGNGTDQDIPLYAPADGRILRIMQQSETTLAAGTPIMEIGNIEGDLEVVVALLSTDAVQVRKGAPVQIVDWGGVGTLSGEVARVDPFGITEYSALGVEEQRVTAVIAFTDPGEDREGLGHGYRVEVRIVTWASEDALTVPTAALFRQGKDWAVFTVEGGKASVRLISIGHVNGVHAEVLGGLEPGERVILYPSTGIAEGVSVSQRQVQ